MPQSIEQQLDDAVQAAIANGLGDDVILKWVIIPLVEHKGADWLKANADQIIQGILAYLRSKT